MKTYLYAILIFRRSTSLLTQCLDKKNLVPLVFLAYAMDASADSGSVLGAIRIAPEVPPAITQQLATDLEMVGSIESTKTSLLHFSVFGQAKGGSYLEWFRKRINTIGYDPDFGTPSSPAIGYNDSNLGNRNNMMLTKYFVQGDLPQMARVVILFHEARHSEAGAGYWRHVICPVPFKDEHGNDIKSIFSGTPLAGLDGCDDTHLGAYGISAIMMLNISRHCSNCTEKVKADAELYGTDQLSRLLRKENRQRILDSLKSRD